MLVVIPVCEKDAWLVLKNLALCDKLGAPYEFTALVSHDDSFDASEVIAETKKRFSRVIVTKYWKWRGEQEWPYPQNHAWQNSARYVEAKKLGYWFWWEADAVPIKAGWLETLSRAYIEGGKPFAGHIVEGMGHMNGVAVYPQEISQYGPNALITRRQPFDKMLPQDAKLIHPINSLIGHTLKWDRNGKTFESRSEVDVLLKSEMILFHGCCDGSLQDLLLQKPEAAPTVLATIRKAIKAPIQRLLSSSVKSDSSGVTVVITNYRRPEFLWNAFESCREAGIERLVVTSSGVTKEVEKVHARIRQSMPQAVIVSEQTDSGSNVNWMRGIEAARTKWVQILHDDDKLLPNYRTISDHLTSADFVFWDGAMHGSSNGLCRLFPKLTYGVHRADAIWPSLMSRRLSPSPVAGCFQKSHLLSVLNACESWDKRFYYRDKLLVGNDLLIWIEASKRYEKLNYLPTPLSSFGAHPGSATVSSLENGANKLMAIYDLVRELSKAKGELPRPKLSLPMVTLVAIDNWRPLRTLRAMRRMMEQVAFGDAVLVTTPAAKRHINADKIRVMDALASDIRVERERYMISRITDTFSTSHCLNVEWDSGVHNLEAWDDAWLEYDYIGAPWAHPIVFHGIYATTPERCVGNSGFALMSKEFAEALAAMPKPLDSEAAVSDVYISLGIRSKLEEHGVKFAPESVALRFSCEVRPFNGQFGWHGVGTAVMNNLRAPL